MNEPVLDSLFMDYSWDSKSNYQFVISFDQQLDIFLLKKIQLHKNTMKININTIELSWIDDYHSKKTCSLNDRLTIELWLRHFMFHLDVFIYKFLSLFFLVVNHSYNSNPYLVHWVIVTCFVKVFYLYFNTCSLYLLK